MKELICIVCPKGCHLLVDEQNNYTVKGNSCKRGEEYGKNELINPTRTITSTVRILNSNNRMLPVKTDKPIAKNLIFDAVKLLNNVEVSSPIKSGDIILKNILNTNVNFIATKTILS